MGVRVRWVEWGVSSLTVSGEGAVGAIDGVEEVVEEALVDVIGLVDWVIGLEQDAVLWVDNGVGDLEVEVRFRASFCYWVRGYGAVDGVESWVGSLRDVGGERSEEVIKIRLTVDVA